MRACEAARAGSAKSAQAPAVRRTMLNLERERFDMATPAGLPKSIRTRFRAGSCKTCVIARVLKASACRSRARRHFHDPLRPRPYHVDDGAVIMNLLQNRPYCLQFDEIAPPGLIFHTLQLVVEGELLVAMIVGEAPAELERRADALKQRGQLLDGRLGGEIVSRRGLALSVFVDQFLGSGECKLVIAGVDLAGKIMGLCGQVEDPGSGNVREGKFGLVGLAVVGVGRDLRRTFVAEVAVGL